MKRENLDFTIAQQFSISSFISTEMCVQGVSEFSVSITILEAITLGLQWNYEIINFGLTSCREMLIYVPA